MPLEKIYARLRLYVSNAWSPCYHSTTLDQIYYSGPNLRDRGDVSWISTCGFRPHSNQCNAFAKKQAAEGELVRAYAAMARLAQQDSA